MHQVNIIVRTAGGLGNQIFQLIAALNLATRRGLPFSSIFIDTRFLGSYEAKHKYEIEFISNLFAGVNISPKLPFLLSTLLRIRLARLVDRKVGPFQLISSVDHLNALCSSDEKSTVYILDGYFQHPDILLTEQERIRVRTTLLTAMSYLIDQVKNGAPTVGIHIRRGDYVTSKSAAKVFRNISIDYYDAALLKLRRDHKVLVFSDDRELSASYAAKVGGIDVRKLKLSLQDEFCLLMACDNHVIANSTFSWWAAYLGHKPGGRIFAPQNWYHDKARSQSNPLLLPHFELVDA